MTRISNECGAINLSQGFPDFDPPKFLMVRLAEVAYEGPHQYPITWGAPNFREAVARKQSRFMGRMLDPNENVLITIGSTEAMIDSLIALCDPGDKIDYLFATEALAAKCRGVAPWVVRKNGIYLSDHHPVCAEFDFG